MGHFVIEAFVNDRGVKLYYRHDHRSAFHTMNDALSNSRGWAHDRPSEMKERWLVHEYRNEWNSTTRDVSAG